MKPSIDALIATAEKMKASSLGAVLTQTVEKTVASVKAGGKILVAGNGGSAAEAQHFAAELVGRYLKERRALPALALTTDTSILTALGNDYTFDIVFARQIEALGRSGDVLFVFSTSGNSRDIISAVAQAKKQGLLTVSFLGGTGGKLAGTCDLEFIVPSTETPRIQEMHLLLVHSISEALENALA